MPIQKVIKRKKPKRIMLFFQSQLLLVIKTAQLTCNNIYIYTNISISLYTYIYIIPIKVSEMDTANSFKYCLVPCHFTHLNKV